MRLNNYSLIITLTVLCACSMLQVSPPPLPLPPAKVLPCCWQSAEQVRVTDAVGSQEFLAAVSFTGRKSTVVVLDNLGQRLVTILHDSNGLQTLDAPGWWQLEYGYQLLTAVYLHYLSREAWQFDGVDWEVIGDTRHRSLVFRGQEHVRLDYTGDGKQSDRTVTYKGGDITLYVRTLSRTDL